MLVIVEFFFSFSLPSAVECREQKPNKKKSGKKRAHNRSNDDDDQDRYEKGKAGKEK